MQESLQKLEKINRDINQAEDEGDKAALAEIIAPEFAFRRASGVLIGRVAFLEAVKMSGPRALEIESIHLHGNRAVVTCFVRMGGKKYHNIRLFVRDNPESDWKLLGWANAEHFGT